MWNVTSNHKRPSALVWRKLWLVHSCYTCKHLVTTDVITCGQALAVDGCTANDLPAWNMALKAFLGFQCRVTGVFFYILISALGSLCGASENRVGLLFGKYCGYRWLAVTDQMSTQLTRQREAHGEENITNYLQIPSFRPLAFSESGWFPYYDISCFPFHLF